MSTAKDLFIIAMDPPPDRPVGQGDLSLALAGAELIDLLDAQAAALDGDRIVPGEPSELHDPAAVRGRVGAHPPHSVRAGRRMAVAPRPRPVRGLPGRPGGGR